MLINMDFSLYMPKPNFILSIPIIHYNIVNEQRCKSEQTQFFQINDSYLATLANLQCLISVFLWLPTNFLDHILRPKWCMITVAKINLKNTNNKTAK